MTFYTMEKKRVVVWKDKKGWQPIMRQVGGRHFQNFRGKGPAWTFSSDHLQKFLTLLEPQTNNENTEQKDETRFTPVQAEALEPEEEVSSTEEEAEPQDTDTFQPEEEVSSTEEEADPQDTDTFQPEEEVSSTEEEVEPQDSNTFQPEEEESSTEEEVDQQDTFQPEEGQDSMEEVSLPTEQEETDYTSSEGQDVENEEEDENISVSTQTGFTNYLYDVDVPTRLFVSQWLQHAGIVPTTPVLH